MLHGTLVAALFLSSRRSFISLSSILQTTPEQLQRAVFGEVIVFYPPSAANTPVNLSASWIARRQIRGPAVLIPEMGLKGRFLYCLLRPGVC